MITSFYPKREKKNKKGYEFHTFLFLLHIIPFAVCYATPITPLCGANIESILPTLPYSTVPPNPYNRMHSIRVGGNKDVTHKHKVVIEVTGCYALPYYYLFPPHT